MTDKKFNSIYRTFRIYYRIGMKGMAKRRLKALIDEYAEDCATDAVNDYLEGVIKELDNSKARGLVDANDFIRGKNFNEGIKQAISILNQNQ